MISNFIDRIKNCIDFSNTVDDIISNTDKQMKSIKKQNKVISSYIEDLNTALAYYKKSVDIIYDRQYIT